MDQADEIVLRINLKISSVDFPQLTQYLKSEPNQMRRTRKLCQLATNGLLTKDTIFPVPHIIASPSISPPLKQVRKVVEVSPKENMKVFKVGQNHVDEIPIGDIKFF